MAVPTFKQALRFWFKLGCISFGGTAAHIALMHDEAVERQGWISNEKFLHALSHCMILPGPEAQQLAIYLGWKLHGKKGGIAAGSLFVLPSMFVLLALSMVYVRFGNMPWIAALFNGLKPTVIALIVIALFRVGGRALRNALQFAVAATAFAAMYFFQLSLLWIVAAVIPLGFALRWIQPSDTSSPIKQETDQPCLFAPALKIVVVATGLWAVPFALLFVFGHDFLFWRQLVLFFTRTAFVTVGGSYTVIPYVAQIAVTKLHWLSQAQMADGFALAETTPGPLIIVLAFVGFMAGYNHFGGSLMMGSIALISTTFYTFLPCFMFVFAGAPLVERSHGNKTIEGVLKMITAVVVGAILNLTLFLGRGILFPSGNITLRSLSIASLVWTGVSILLLKRFRMNVVSLIALSLGFGLIRWKLHL